jgi:hypothetical protein
MLIILLFAPGFLDGPAAYDEQSVQADDPESLKRLQRSSVIWGGMQRLVDLITFPSPISSARYPPF